MKGKIILSIVLILIASFSKVVYATENIDSKITFSRITISDGLSQATIQSIFQDSDGYMWFGTEDGLNRYDGINFKFYRYSEEEGIGLSSNWIRNINQDSSGNIWVSTTKGINIIDKVSGNIKTYTEEQGLSDDSVRGTFIDSKERVLIYTDDGINIYNSKEDRFERIFYSEEEILTSQYIIKIQESSDGTYWIATDDGLNNCNLETGEVVKYKVNEKSENSISNNYIEDLFFDDNNDVLWIATRGGLNKLDLITKEIVVFKHDENNSSSIPSDLVNCVIKDNNNRLWVGTDKGFSLYNEETQSFVTYKTRIYDSTSLVNNEVINIYQDKSNMIWIGTVKGISYFNPDGIFKSYRHDPFDNNTISGDMIFGLYEDDSGLLWVGTANNGVNVIDRENNKVYRLDEIQEAKKIFKSNSISDINGSGDNIWIATSTELIYINKKTNEVKKFFEDNNIEILNIYIDSDGLVWIAERAGLYSIDKDFNIKNYNDEFSKNDINDRYVSMVFEDSNGIMWIGMGIDGGLLKYNRETGVIKQYKNIEGDNTSLSYNSVKDVNEDAYGNIWVATNSGLNKYNKEEDNFKRYTELDGLSNNFVYKILIDSNQNLWLSTNYGISRYDQEKDKFINFNVGDGLQGSEFNKNAGFKSKSGEMFFGGISGLNSFFPEKFTENDISSNIVIDKIKVDGQYINFVDDIKLKYSDENLKIEYFLPDYTNPKMVMYAYKLEGVDNEWILSKTSRDLNYNNLKSGNYKLLIAGKNSLGVWSEVKEINIYKEKAPWNRPIAYVIYIIIILLVIYIVRSIVRLLDKMVKIRTQELNNTIENNKIIYKKNIETEINKNNYFINLSHELRTPLNIILSTQQLISNLNKSDEHIAKSKIDYYMGILKNNSNRLLKLINDIIDTSKIESGQYKLNIEEHDIIYHVEEMVFDMKDFIEGKGIEFIVDPEIEEKIIECDINDIEKCVINILGNAVKFTPAGGKIEVIVKEGDNKVKILIKDTGIGIAKDDLDTIFNRFGQAYNKKSEEFGGSGIGLSLTKQLIELHNGELLVESELGKGSTFVIILPIRQ